VFADKDHVVKEGVRPSMNWMGDEETIQPMSARISSRKSMPGMRMKYDCKMYPFPPKKKVVILMIKK
jgi:hypothetical protein